MEHDGSNWITRQTWGLDLSQSPQGAGGVGGLVMVETLPSIGAPVPHFPTYDGNGNITAWVNASGTVVARQRYDAFGQIIEQIGTAPSNNGFSSKPIENVTGFNYYGYRYYDAITGRWPSRDPIEEKGGVNLYGFCYNDSFEWIDYLGNAPMSGGVGGPQVIPPHGFYYTGWQPRPTSGPLDSTDIKPPTANPKSEPVISTRQVQHFRANPCVPCGTETTVSKESGKAMKLGLSAEYAAKIGVEANYLAAKISAEINVKVGVNAETTWDEKRKTELKIPGPEGKIGKKHCWCVYQTAKEVVIGPLSMVYEWMDGFNPVDNGLIDNGASPKECPLTLDFAK